MIRLSVVLDDGRILGFGSKCTPTEYNCPYWFIKLFNNSSDIINDLSQYKEFELYYTGNIQIILSCECHEISLKHFTEFETGMNYKNLDVLDFMEHSLLMESLDSRYNIVRSVPYGNVNGVEDYTEHHTEDPDHTFYTFKKGDAYEIHHSFKGISGEPVNSKTPALKFAGTALHLAKGIMKYGHKVRIAGSEEMVNDYHKIAKLLGRRDGYQIGDLEPYEDFSGVGKQMLSFTVNK
jgi:hypothetical protein